MIVVLLALLCTVYGDDPLRLIAFNETYSQWMRESEVQKLAQAKETHFMDITEYPAPIKYSGPTVKIPTGPTHQTVVHPLLRELSSANIGETVRWLSAYSTRYYTSTTGLQAVNALIQEYSAHGNKHPKVEVQDWTHSWLQPSVIARIHGHGNAAKEIVIIGGHVDSTSSGANAPGADDDASGSATVLEVFRVLTAELHKGWVPERTLEFHGYAAEEVGLRGSQAIATSYAAAGEQVVGMLQLDMTGYIGGGTATIGVVTDASFTNVNLNAFIRTLIPEYTKFSNGGTNTACNYACSDHASWARSGFPASFAFESTFQNSNPYIHTPNDQLNRLNLPHMLEFAKLALSFVVELSYEEK